MKKKNAANEASKMIMIGMAIAGIRVLVFELDDLWVLALEVVVAAAVAAAVRLPVALATSPLTALVEAVLKAPAADREASSAGFVTMTELPLLVYVVKKEAVMILVPVGELMLEKLSLLFDDCGSVSVAIRPRVLSRSA